MDRGGHWGGAVLICKVSAHVTIPAKGVTGEVVALQWCLPCRHASQGSQARRNTKAHPQV